MTIRRRPSITGWQAVLLGAVLIAGVAADCSGGDTYGEFKNALHSGASCAELVSQRGNFDSKKVLERINTDLERIGCESRDSKRVEP